MRTLWHHIPKMLIWASVGALLLFMQSAHVGNIGGVQINFLLVFALLATFFADSFVILVVPALLVLLSAFINVPFWGIEVTVLVVLGLLFYFVRRFLTGNRFSDLLIGIAVVTVLFYVLLSIFFHIPLVATMLMLEIVYNLAFGALVWIGIMVTMRV